MAVGGTVISKLIGEGFKGSVEVYPLVSFSCRSFAVCEVILYLLLEVIASKQKRSSKREASHASDLTETSIFPAGLAIQKKSPRNSKKSRMLIITSQLLNYLSGQPVSQSQKLQKNTNLVTHTVILFKFRKKKL